MFSIMPYGKQELSCDAGEVKEFRLEGLMSQNKPLENRIMETVRQSPPSKPVDIVNRVSKDAEEAKTARETIRSLVDRGDLLVTLDWKVRAGR